MAYTLKGLIYGQPGIGKSTIALSAPKPFIIDTEGGLKRVNAEFAAMAGKMVLAATDDKRDIQQQPYQQILNLLNSNALDKYETIIIDTAGRLIDRINDWLAVTDPKQKKGDGAPSLQGYGAIKKTFSNFLKLVDSKGKSIIFVAHEKEEKSGEKFIKRPDISGSSGKELIKDLDFIGYMSKVGNIATIDFNPSEFYYAKNSIGTNDFLEFPKIKGLNNFLTTQVFEKAEKKKLEDAFLGVKFSSLIAKMETSITELKTLEEVNEYYVKCFKKHEEIWCSFIVEAQALDIKTKSLGLIFNKADKLFVLGVDKNA